MRHSSMPDQVSWWRYCSLEESHVSHMVNPQARFSDGSGPQACLKVTRGQMTETYHIDGVLNRSTLRVGLLLREAPGLTREAIR